VAQRGKRKPRLGVLVGGGPAPGINGVIGAVTMEAHRLGVEVVGIYDGFRWLARGDTDHVTPLTPEVVDGPRLRGGSMLHTSRENPTKSAKAMANVVGALEELGVKHLVTIGGDDTAFSAYKTWERTRGAISVAHVPKTVDNDLPLPGAAPTFGFRTACHVGGALVRNLREDARTTRRWYLVVAMGRSAGHLALGMASAGGAALAVIPEEFAGRSLSLEGLCQLIEASMYKAKALGRDHGVVVVAEGVAELMKSDLEAHPFAVSEVDEHGHPRLSEVPLALIIKRALAHRAAERGKKRTIVDVTIGYELRCADPIAFDIEYTHQLGWGAVRYLLQAGEASGKAAGALISIQHGELMPIPLPDILDVKTGRTEVRRVNLESDVTRAAFDQMIRLEAADLKSRESLARLAEAAELTPKQFREQYGHLVEL